MQVGTAFLLLGVLWACAACAEPKRRKPAPAALQRIALCQALFAAGACEPEYRPGPIATLEQCEAMLAAGTVQSCASLLAEAEAQEGAAGGAETDSTEPETPEMGVAAREETPPSSELDETPAQQAAEPQSPEERSLALGLGQGCSADDDCAQGACVAGPNGARICCESRCDGVCEACGADGRCDVAPELDERCPAVACPQDNVCRDYAPTLDGGRCSGLGECLEASPDACLEGPLRPDATCLCDEQGDCGLTLASACDRDGDCDSGACEESTDGTFICCQTGCGTGLSCATDGSACVECEGADVSCRGSDQVTCENGLEVVTPCANGCTPALGCDPQAPIGASCAQSTCRAPGVCQTDTVGAQRCCASNCAAEGRVCSPDGSCQCPPGQVEQGGDCRLPVGNPCTANADCQNNRCVDGVCCAETCGAVCEQCQLGSGQCVAVVAREQEPGCNNTRECSGRRGECGTRIGRSCDVNEVCPDGNCEPTAGGGGNVCCEQECGTGGFDFCSADGERCVQCEFSGTICRGENSVQCDDGRERVTTCDHGCEGGECAPGLGNGDECTSNDECESRTCNEWFQDLDGDGYGDPGESRRTCGTASSQPPSGFVRDNTDCCDRGGPQAVVAGSIHPDQTELFRFAQDVCPNIGSFNYDCVAAETYEYQADTEAGGGTCNFSGCAGSTIWSINQGSGNLPPCGESGLLIGCAEVPGSSGCRTVPVGNQVNRCR